MLSEAGIIAVVVVVTIVIATGVAFKRAIEDVKQMRGPRQKKLPEKTKKKPYWMRPAKKRDLRE